MVFSHMFMFLTETLLQARFLKTIYVGQIPNFKSWLIIHREKFVVYVQREIFKWLYFLKYKNIYILMTFYKKTCFIF